MVPSGREFSSALLRSSANQHALPRFHVWRERSVQGHQEEVEWGVRPDSEHSRRRSRTGVSRRQLRNWWYGEQSAVILNGGARCSSVVRAFAHGVMGRRIDPSCGGPIELFLVPASAPRLV